MRKFLRKKQEILANIEANCLFLLMQSITQQYEHTHKIIHSESSNDNEMQEEMLKISKK